MKRLGLVVAVLVLAVVAWRPVTGQDNYEERIASLETRVALLEAGTPVAASASASGTHTFKGTVTVTGSQTNLVEGTLEDDRECYGRPGSEYADLDVGLAVTVRDDTGKILAASTVGSTSSGYGTGSAVVCMLEFTVEGVPDAAFYAVSLGHRGEVVFDREDLELFDWRVLLTIG